MRAFQPVTTRKAPHVALGRCHRCDRGYAWTRRRGRTLHTVTCPRCGGRLRQTTFHYQGDWFHIDDDLAAQPEEG